VVGEGGYDKRARAGDGRRRELKRAAGQLRRLGLNKSGQSELAAPTSSATTIKEGWMDGGMDGKWF
jgi:hypothetical protein